MEIAAFRKLTVAWIYAKSTVWHLTGENKLTILSLEFQVLNNNNKKIENYY